MTRGTACSGWSSPKTNAIVRSHEHPIVRISAEVALPVDVKQESPHGAIDPTVNTSTEVALSPEVKQDASRGLTDPIVNTSTEVALSTEVKQDAPRRTINLRSRSVRVYQ